MTSPKNGGREPYRPGFHFTAPTGWLNDPNGLVYHDGEYHMFYQWCPALEPGPGSPDMYWGHAVSRDLVRWTHLPPALAPDRLGSIWSGSAVEDPANTCGQFAGSSGLVAVFTHHAPDGAERQSLAFSDDRGRTWRTFAANPVLGDAASRDFRDPKVFWHAETDRWIMIIGCRHKLYASSNLRDWQFLGETGFSSECPDLFPLPVEGEPLTKWVVSLGGRQYVVGTFDGVRFTAETGALEVDGGPDFYATQSWGNSPDGRRIWIGWQMNWKYAAQVPDFGARGVMTVPRVLTLRRQPDGSLRLAQKPVTELDTLRGPPASFAPACVTAGQTLATGDQFDIVAVVAADGGDVCGLSVLAGDGCETKIGVDGTAGAVFVDRSRSGLELSPGRVAVAVPAGRVALRILVDRGALETFINDGQAVITAMVFTGAATPQVSWFSANGRSRLESLSIYPMRRA